ncbi:MAG TPA: beta-ketoacyl synthase, partial [Cyanobacteria bacterium UBA11148]|nr:beta-ketoacyl synthase [Cyanobacteria bacterium UBA11148]
LSTPRAGSTLLRVMLAGHPALFSPPELHLLPFEGMAEWSEELGLSYLGEGLQRAFMELLDIDGNASKKLIEDLTQQDISIQNVYARLQELAGKRLLVDKSPSYAASMQTLERSEELFAGAKYIHLVRHPYAVIESFVRNRIDKILGIEEFDPHFVAEQIWVRINRNILEFGQQIDSSRYHLLRYEELVSDPATVMNGLCEFLEIPFDEAVLQPYEGKRMTDGVHPESLPINDPNFLKHNKIESSLGNVWKQIKLPQLLGEAAKQIAVELQYELPLEKQNGEKETENSSTNLTPLPTLHYPLPTPKKMQESYLNVRGLNLCLCSWGSEIAPLILCVHGILEHGAAWEGVANSLVNLGYRVVAPDQRGHGRSDHALMGGSYQLLDYLGDLDAIVPELTNQPFILMGHSMGSAVAATFASLRPDKVKQLVLVEPVLPAEVNDEEVATQLATHLDYLASPPQHPILTDVKIAAERLRQWTPLMSEELALKTATRLTEPCDGGVRWRWDSRLQIRTGLGFSGTVFNRTRYTQIVRQIQAPITLVYGDNSNFNKPEDLALQEAVMSQANRITLSGGHNLPIDAPEALATVIAQAARNIV